MEKENVYENPQEQPSRAEAHEEEHTPQAGVHLEQERSHRYRALNFPEVVGKKAARVELVTSDEYHAVVVVFDDNTAVGFEFQPCFTVQAFVENIDGVGGEGSKNWPKILNER